MISIGDILISDISLAEDFIFRRSVILICNKESESNPMGFIINKPLQYDLSREILKINKKFILHFGGPVSSDILFCLHKNDINFESSKKITKNLSFGCNLDEIIEKTKNNELNNDNVMFFLGYSGWTKNQLLREIKEKHWKVNTEYSNQIFKKSKKNLWKKLTKKIEGDASIWANAPENILDN